MQYHLATQIQISIRDKSGGDWTSARLEGWPSSESLGRPVLWPALRRLSLGNDWAPRAADRRLAGQLHRAHGTPLQGQHLTRLTNSSRSNSKGLKPVVSRLHSYVVPVNFMWWSCFLIGRKLDGVRRGVGTVADCPLDSVKRFLIV